MKPWKLTNSPQKEKHSVTYYCITIVSPVKDFEKDNSLGYIPRDSELPGKLAAMCGSSLF